MTTKFPFTEVCLENESLRAEVKRLRQTLEQVYEMVPMLPNPEEDEAALGKIGDLVWEVLQ